MGEIDSDKESSRRNSRAVHFVYYSSSRNGLQVKDRGGVELLASPSSWLGVAFLLHSIGPRPLPFPTMLQDRW